MRYDFSNIKIFIEDDYTAMGKRGAEVFSEQLAANPNGNYGFATGSTPVSMYQELIRRYQAGDIDFSNINTFNLDEYYPIKKENNQSYDYFMKENLFRHVNLDLARMNIPNGEATDYQQECEAYEERIKAAGGIDLQILGIGTNGHIGFNEPNAYFMERTNYATLTASTIQSNKIYFASEDEMPKHAISMGIGSIMMARKILMLISGANKAEAAAQLLFGNITPQVPATALRLHQDVTIVLDQDAAKLIKDRL